MYNKNRSGNDRDWIHNAVSISDKAFPLMDSQGIKPESQMMLFHFCAVAEWVPTLGHCIYLNSKWLISRNVVITQEEYKRSCVKAYEGLVRTGWLKLIDEKTGLTQINLRDDCLRITRGLRNILNKKARPLVTFVDD